MTSPLFVTRDADPARRAAAAGRRRRRHPRRRARRRGRRCAAGRRAPLVLVGADVAAEVARDPAAATRRVHVVGWGRGARRHLPGGPRGRRRERRRAAALGARGWSSRSPTSATPSRGPRADRRRGRAARGGAGRDDVRLRARAARPRRCGPARSSSTSTRSARASTGCSASSRATASAGTRSARPPAGSAPGRCARRCRGATGSACSPGRRAARLAAGVRRPRGAVGRAARARPGGARPAPHRATRSSTRWSPAATGCWSWSRADGGRASPSAARLRARLPTRSGRAAGGARAAASSRARSSGRPGVPGARAAMADQRGLAESIDLGLGPVRSRRGPLGRAAARGARPRWRSRSAGRRRERPRERPARGRRRRGPRPAGPQPGDADARTGSPRRCARPGRPVGDADGARRPRGAARATSSAPARSSRCSGRPASPTCWSTAPTQVYLDRGAGPGADAGAVPRRRGGAPAGPAAGGARAVGASTTPRRTSTCGCADGTRFHAVLAPVAAPGTLVSLRVPRRAAFTLDELVAPARSTDDGARLLRRRGRGAAGVPGQRRHRLGQDHPARRPARRWSDPAERLVLVEDAASCAPTTRTWSRSRRGRPTSRVPARSSCATWSARRCGCGPTGWWSARCGAARWSSCWPRSTPATRAAAAPSTPTPRATSPPGSRRWRWPPASAATRRTASSPRPSTSVLHLGARTRRRRARSARSRCRCGAPTGWSSMRTGGRVRRRRRRTGPAPAPTRLAARLDAMTLVRGPGRGAGGSAGRRRPGRRAPVAAPTARGWSLPALGGAAGAGRRAGGPGRRPVLAVLAAGVGVRRCWCSCRRRSPDAGSAAAGVAARVLETCELLAAELAAGQPPGQALDHAAAAWPPLASGRRGVHASGGDVPDGAARRRPHAGCPRPAPARRGLAGGAPHRRTAWPTRSARSPTRSAAAHADAPAGRGRARVGPGHGPAGRRPARARPADGVGRRRRPVGLPARPPVGLACLAAGLAFGLRRAVVDRGDRGRRGPTA